MFKFRISVCHSLENAACELYGQGEEGEGQEKHNRKELKRMIYLYQQTEKGEQMICDSREKGGKTTQNKGEKDSKNSVKRAF